MTLTVVIPVWNGEATLPSVLRALKQQLRSSDNLVIVDDGSTDATSELAERECSLFPCRVQRIQQEHRGAAAARNAGIAAATTELVLFLGADILPGPSLIDRHRSIHMRTPEPFVGCLGFVTWDPMLPPTPFMVWLEHGGPQNAYGEIAGHTQVDLARYCYGANISFKRNFLEDAGGFDGQQFCTYGWEDCDLGIRLADRGGRLLYEPAARAYHMHNYSFAVWKSRQIAAGESFVTLARMHPQRHPLPPTVRGWRYTIRRLLYHSLLGRVSPALVRFAERRWIIPNFYARISGWMFTESVHKSLPE